MGKLEDVLNDPEMQELLKAAGELDKEIQERDDSEYSLNREQWYALLEAYGFFTKLAERTGGRVEPLDLKPREEIGHIVYTGRVFEAVDREIQILCRGLKRASVFMANVEPDGEICIRIAFPGVFVRTDPDGYPIADDTEDADDGTPKK